MRIYRTALVGQLWQGERFATTIEAGATLANPGQKANTHCAEILLRVVKWADQPGLQYTTVIEVFLWSKSLA